MRPLLLVLRALGLGDLLTGVPALRALRRGYPDHEIVLAAPAVLGPLVAATGAVDRLWPTAAYVRAPVDGLAFGGRRPALAVNLHGRGPQSHRALLALRPGRLLAFASPAANFSVGPQWSSDEALSPAQEPASTDDVGAESVRVRADNTGPAQEPAGTAHEHEVARWCRLLSWYGLRADRDDLLLPVPAQRPPWTDAVVVHPGASGAERRWPAERFAAVARALRADGHRVVVTGTPEERTLAEAVACTAGLPAADVLAGRTSLTTLAALVAGARLVVCGDTGIAHLATAYRTPSVVLMGPMPPALWGPPAQRPEHVALWHGKAGLGAIGVDEVLASARVVAAGAGRAAAAR